MYNEKTCRRVAIFLLAGVASAAIQSQAAQAQFAATINASTIGSTNAGLKINSAPNGDRTGESMANAGDFNGDGIDDLLIGSSRTDANAISDTGAAYVVFGKRNFAASSIDLSALNGSNGFVINGAITDDQIGSRVAGAGDFNGDGYSDIAIGAPFASPGGNAFTGKAYLVFGRPTPLPSVLQLSSLTSGQGFVIESPLSGDRLGIAVDINGDLNGDGFDDLVVTADAAGGAPQTADAAYVMFGRATPPAATVNVTSLSGVNGFRIENEPGTSQFAFSATHVADMSGDGRSELAIGHLGNSAVIVYGKTAFPSILNVSTIAPGAATRINGPLGVSFATSMADAGDVNGDGFNDLVVGASQTSYSATSAGSAYVVFGKSGGLATSLDASALDGGLGFRLDGAAGFDSFGSDVSGGGDVNGDGFDDLLVGAPNAGASQDGSATVFFGKGSGFAATVATASLNASSGFKIVGVTGSDRLGSGVAIDGDFNGDGFDDVLAGAPDAISAVVTEASYLLFGRDPGQSVARIGSPAGQYISGSNFNDKLFGVGGGDVLEGRGGRDLLDGSIGADTASYAHAPAGVVANLAKPSRNTKHAKGDTYLAIENLEGTRFDDKLTGNGSANRLTGGKGKDMLRGGGGRDTFAYRLAAESPANANRDQILDFNPGTASTFVDRIGLAAIDADASRGGNQAFKFIGTNAFSKKGQLRLKKTPAGILVQGNTQGATGADFEILLKGLSNTGAFTAKDFKL
jgi:Ca2+-binding RTX toxin-like protein